LITAQDLSRPEFATFVAAPRERVAAAPLATSILHFVLFVAVLLSSIAFIEPSPHDFLIALLAIACLAASVHFERKILPLVFLLMVWNVSALFSLFEIVGNAPALLYVGTSFYLAVAAILFACLTAENSMRRLEIIRRAYLATALIATLVGIAAYFDLMPGADLFRWQGRVRASFKDPNVYGPFLILPILFLVEGMVARRLRAGSLIAAMVLLAGLLLSYSRGAWIHFAISIAVLLMLLMLTAPSSGSRVRVFGMSLTALLGITLVIISLTAIDSFREMLTERAQLQSYDVGEGGRFHLQELALGVLFDQPFGLGPFEFERLYGLQQHNVYLQAFIVYGWVGGLTYITLVLLTLMLGLRSALVRTPWQPYLIAIYATFVGAAVEGFVIDTDHWRHFFLLLGLIWGLSAATINVGRRAASGINATDYTAMRVAS
jgi:O-antigen ligase